MPLPKHVSFTNRFLCLLACALLCGLPQANTAFAQAAVVLPDTPPSAAPIQQSFHFASDGPIGPGWSRPDEIARVYFKEDLPALFRRTLTLKEPIPHGGKLSWIFTGPRAGFTVELTASKVRLFQRYYDSFGLYSGQGNYPQKTVRDSEQQFVGHVQTLTVIVDSHLSVRVLVNGRTLIEQSCVFDVTRHQLMFSAPRTVHDVLDGALLQEKPLDATVRLDPQEKYQTMLGFGGSPSIPAYDELSAAGKQQYWQLIRRYNLLLDREYPMGTQLKPDLSNLQNLADATPHYYGDNFPNGEVSSFDYNRHILDLGGSVIYELWALPNWATQSYNNPTDKTVDAWGKVVRKAAKPDEYARLVVTYCKLAKEHTGKAPAIVGIQNEVEEPTAVFDQMVLTLRRELDKAGFTSTKIHMADASFLYMGIDRARALQKDPAVWKDIDFTAAHQYDYQEFFANPDLYDARLRAMHAASAGKPFLATEICINDPHYQEPSYRIALNTAQLYHKNLTELDAEAILYCWLLLDVEQPSFGASRALLVPDRMNGSVPVASSFQLRVFGAYSRHILKGMTRIGATSSNPDLLVSAYSNGKEKTLVLLNRSISALQVRIPKTGTPWKQIEHTSPYAENLPTSAPEDLSSLKVLPGEIVTLSSFDAE
ncbi:MAG: glycoside hydrolase [Acidobacteriaceae bacterium]